MVVYMKKELCVKGFSAISDNEMLDVNGGDVGTAIVITAIVVFCICLTGSSTSTSR